VSGYAGQDALIDKDLSSARGAGGAADEGRLGAQVFGSSSRTFAIRVLAIKRRSRFGTMPFERMLGVGL